MSASFAVLADVALLTLGGRLKRREMLSARLGDVLGELYLASCALKRFEEDGEPAEDLVLVRWCCERALVEAERRFDEVLANLPARPVAWALRGMLFPFGRVRRPPSDALTRRCAELLLTPSPARDRLTAGLHLGDADGNLARLEQALEAAIAAEAVEEKLRPVIGRAAVRARDPAALKSAVARGAASPADLRTLERCDALRAEVIAVDDFEPAAFERKEPTWTVEPKTAAPSMS